MTRLPDATERRIAAVHAAADKIRFQLGQSRDHAWTAGHETGRGNKYSADLAEKREQKSSHELGDALTTLVQIALHVDEDGAL
ncbi:MAG: hypothetical protein HOV66_07845 [Streptomycetaceae bacterium]|nr:hypothetical protein [Streptomycetaceae bacterium]NUS54761.1 hypothetical protein [Streptomycetaceae bacterium]